MGFLKESHLPLLFFKIIKNSSVCFYVCMLSCFSRVWLFATISAVAHQASLSMGFSRQEYWSGLLCPPPGDLPDPGIEPASPSLLSSLPLRQQGSPSWTLVKFKTGVDRSLQIIYKHKNLEIKCSGKWGLSKNNFRQKWKSHVLSKLQISSCWCMSGVSC